jgi:hypothetical protein
LLRGCHKTLDAERGNGNCEAVFGPEPCQFNPKHKGFGFDSDQNPIYELEKTPLGVTVLLLSDLHPISCARNP